MGHPGSLTLPADAADKAAEKAKTTDFYADLTDEERAEEGLPPREPAKEEPEPAAKPDAEPGPKEEPEPEEREDDEETVDLLAELSGLRDEVRAAIRKEEPEMVGEPEDEVLAAALEHDDPVVRALAEKAQALEKRLEARERAAHEEKVDRQLAKDTADFDAVRENYTIGGKPVTDAQIEQIEDWILAHEQSGSELTIEQVTRVVFPDAVKKPPAAKAGAAAAGGKGAPVATIVDAGSAGGAPAGPWKPRPNETIESAVQAAGKRFGWTR